MSCKLFRGIATSLVTIAVMLTPLGSAISRADEYPDGEAQLAIPKNPEERAPDLLWKTNSFPVQIMTTGDKSQPVATIRGEIKDPDTSLVFNRHEVQSAPDISGGKSFEFNIPLVGPVTRVSLLTVDAHGRTHEEKIALRFPGWEGYLAHERALKSRFFSSVGLGLSYLHYTELNVIDLAEVGVTGKYNATYILDPNHWELSGNIFGTLVPLELSPGDRATARFYGVNARVGYRLPIDRIPNTQLWLMTGWYVWGMYVNATADDTYGVAYLAGPQLYLTARITPHQKRSSWLYLKIASIQNDLNIFSLTNREFAVGGGTEISAPESKRHWSLSLDFADAKFADSLNSFELFSRRSPSG